MLATHFCHALKWISARAWMFGPRARIRCAWSGRNLVLSATTGGTEMEYCAHGDAFAASVVARRSQSVWA